MWYTAKQAEDIKERLDRLHARIASLLPDDPIRKSDEMAAEFLATKLAGCVIGVNIKATKQKITNAEKAQIKETKRLTLEEKKKRQQEIYQKEAQAVLKLWQQGWTVAAIAPAVKMNVYRVRDIVEKSGVEAINYWMNNGAGDPVGVRRPVVFERKINRNNWVEEARKADEASLRLQEIVANESATCYRVSEDRIPKGERSILGATLETDAFVNFAAYVEKRPGRPVNKEVTDCYPFSEMVVVRCV